MKQADIHVRILNSSSTEALMEVYDEWADRYDADLTEDWGYDSPALAVRLLDRYLGVSGGTILDAGCGTGLVGARLKTAGAAQVSGIDYSEGMLRKAKEKGVYTQLEQMDMNAPLMLPTGCFDAVTCIGTFTSTHVRPEALWELVRVTRADGMIVFTVRDDYWTATRFADLVVRLHGEGHVAIEEIRTEPYIRSEGSHCKCVVLRVL